MATSKLDVAGMVANLIGDEGGGKTPPAKIPFTQDELNFGNWTGQTDVSVMAKDLQKRGLVGADQILYGGVNSASEKTIRGSQPAWKPAMLQEVMSNIYKYKMRKPEEIIANKTLLAGKWKDAINNPFFDQVHPNFWQVVTENLVPEQYSKFDKINNTQTANR